MLDINLFREDRGGNPEMIRESQRRRFDDPAVVDKVIELDSQWRSSIKVLENKRKDFGIANKAVAAKKKAKENADEELAAVKAIAAEIKEQETVVNELKTAVDTLVRSMGNLVPDSVPIAEEEDGNRVERTWGEPRQEDGLRTTLT